MITVVIPTWNGLHHLQQCLPSLTKQTFKDFDVIVVDNGSTDNSISWLIEKYPNVQIIGLKENTGFSYAVNIGIKHAKGDKIVLLNNDTIPDENWLYCLNDAAKKYQDYDFFASKVIHLNPENTIDTAGDGFTIAGFGFKRGWMMPADTCFNEPEDVFGASACAALYRRKFFEITGYFDEDFFAFGEDIDISFRANLMGLKCKYCPQAKVIHKVRATANPENTIIWSVRNNVWINVKNMPFQLILLYMPFLIAQFILTFLRSLKNRQIKLFLKGCYLALKQKNKMLEKRRMVQKRRKIQIALLKNRLTSEWLQVHLNNYRRKSSK